MQAVLFIDWTSSDVTNADLSIHIYDTSEFSTIYSSTASAVAQTFIYTLDSTLYDGTYYNVGVDITTAPSLLNGDTSAARVVVKEISVYEENQYGCLHIDTSFSIELSMPDATLNDTSFYADITREDFAEAGGCGVFFTAHDISGIESFVENPGYGYDTETRGNYSDFSYTTIGQFAIYKDTTFVSGGCGASLELDFSVGDYWYDTSVCIYIGNVADDFSSATYLGCIYDRDFVNTPTTIAFDVPGSVMLDLVNQDFSDTWVYLAWGDKTSSGVLYLYDVRLVFDKGYDGTALDTTFSLVVYDATTPVEAAYIETENIVRVHSGDSFVFDYYTPGAFVDLDIGTSYTYEVWNNIELWLQNIARYFSSPLTFETNVPEHIDIVVNIDSSGQPSVASLYKENEATVEVDGTALLVYVGLSDSGLLIPSVVASPSRVITDGTAYSILGEYSGGYISLFFYNVSTGGIVDLESDGVPINSATTITLLGFGRRYYGR